MARTSRAILSILPLHLVLLLACAILPVDGGHYYHPITNLLHRRHSNTSVNARLAALMPRAAVESWTTVPGRGDSSRKLDDSTFKPMKAMSNPKWYYGPAPDGKRSLIAKYPKGSYTFTHEPKGGFSFYAPGPIDLSNAREVTFGYSVWFPDGFEFNKGGKLPGLCAHTLSLLLCTQLTKSQMEGTLTILQRPVLVVDATTDASPHDSCGAQKELGSFTPTCPQTTRRTRKSATSHRCLNATRHMEHLWGEAPSISRRAHGLSSR